MFPGSLENEARTSPSRPLQPGYQPSDEDSEDSFPLNARQKSKNKQKKNQFEGEF